MSRYFACFVLALLIPAAGLAETEAGYRRSLFDGQTLQGWHVTDCEVAVSDGSIVALDGNGFIRSDHRYRDFVLELKWRARKEEAWDSGIYIRCDLPAEGKPWPAQYQINLKQGDEGNLIRFPKARSQGLTRPGEWNQLSVRVVGDTAEMTLNGQPAWTTDGLTQREGYIGFQVEAPLGGQFEFKDIFITELNHRPLFNGNDLSGWEGGGADASLCWKVEEGQLVCTGEKGPWLRSQEEFEDFNLRLDYKLKPGGNSGVYLRVAEDGRHRDPGEGVEIQILDDGAERYRELQPYQYTGSIYAIAPPTARVAREPGNWNSLEIDCRGHSYVIRHNGQVVVEANEQTSPALAERRLAGFLGLQNHSEEVWFRDIRIGPSMQPPPEAGCQ